MRIPGFARCVRRSGLNHGVQIVTRSPGFALAVLAGTIVPSASLRFQTVSSVCASVIVRPSHLLLDRTPEVATPT